MNLSQEGKVSLISQYQLNVTCCIIKIKGKIHTNILITKKELLTKPNIFMMNTLKHL